MAYSLICLSFFFVEETLFPQIGSRDSEVNYPNRAILYRSSGRTIHKAIIVRTRSGF